MREFLENYVQYTFQDYMCSFFCKICMLFTQLFITCLTLTKIAVKLTEIYNSAESTENIVYQHRHINYY